MKINFLLPIQLYEKLETFVNDTKEKKETIRLEKSHKQDFHSEMHKCIDEWKRYNNCLDLVEDENLINYYSYLLKAQEARLAYLQKNIM